MDSLDKIILRAIPKDNKCAIQEAYNTERRRWLKEKFIEYLQEQLSTQFNARPAEDKICNGLGEGTHGLVTVS